MLAALWIGLALLLAAIGIGYLFVRTVEQNVRMELSAGISRIAAVIDTDAATLALSQSPGDPRYDIPLSGYYWQIDPIQSGASLRSASLWDAVLAPRIGPGENQQFARLAGPNGQTLSALTRQIDLPGGVSYLVTVAADRGVIDQSIKQFGMALLVGLALLGASLMGAAYLQVRLGLAPLDSVRIGVAAVRRGDGSAMLGVYPREVQPLVAEIDALLASQASSVEFARHRAADLAHGLKTPLAVLGNLAETLRSNGDGDIADKVDTLAGEMLERIDYQLHLSRLRHRTRQHVLRASLETALQRTLAVVERTPQGEKLAWTVNADPLDVDIDVNDLIELLGVVLENAARWATDSILVTAQRVDDMAEVTVRDDGPGLDDAQLSALGQRGRRFDESGSGHGLGLAIASNIVALNGGSMVFERPESGGLLVRLRLPLASAIQD
ncbi:MAG: sensor histidine kinase [Devosia sp.]|uniref:sensor histidine kinase n=1 Tax=Devosia sp. TaxID=1871048 RepID=UPI002603EE82|nr:HAMP domain-containing sensor histidine kinase [Devosia sp.]MDB5529474.1 sensor histidine kinase [Devosia sp.]